MDRRVLVPPLFILCLLVSSCHPWIAKQTEANMTHEFLTFTRRLEFMEATTISQDEYCDLWIGVWKLSQGRKDFCETEFLSQALVINEDNIIPFVWMLHYANHVSDQLQEDILASLTSLPYWFDNGGRFQIRMGNQIRYLDHSQETNQLVWLSSSYLIGEFFSMEQDKRDIVFEGVNETSLTLLQNSRHRLWAFLDRKRTIGFKQLDSRIFHSLLSLASLCQDQDLAKLAKMMAFVEFQSLESIFFEFGLVSNLVEPGSKSDLTALHWLLTGRGLEPKLKDFSTSLLLNLAIGLGFEIPKLFLGSLSTIQTIPYDISVKSCSDLKFTSTDDCVFRFGEIGMLGSIDCFKSVGDVFKLWNRHHQWSNMDPFRKLVISSDSTLVEQMQDVHCRFSKYLGGSALQLRRNPRFLAFWSQVRDPGSYGRSLDYTSWTLKVTGGESMNIEQNINLHSSKLKVLPKVANFKDTFFILNNPKLTTSSILDTGSTQAHLNLFFQRAFADDNHWFIGQIQDQFLAIYSHQPVNWTSVVSPRRIVKSLTAPGSQNVWIVHAESGGTFETFAERIFSSQLVVHFYYSDGFHECLHENGCLDHGPYRFLECLRGDCPLENYAENSVLAACLSNPRELKGVTHLTALEAIQKMGHCLSEPLFDIILKWQLDRKVFQIGWKQDLELWEDNERVPTNCAEVPAPSKRRKIMDTSGHTLELDFELLRYF